MKFGDAEKRDIAEEEEFHELFEKKCENSRVLFEEKASWTENLNFETKFDKDNFFHCIEEKEEYSENEQEAKEIEKAPEIYGYDERDEKEMEIPIYLSHLGNQDNIHNEIYNACLGESTNEWKTMEYLMSNDLESEEEDQYMRMPLANEWQEENSKGYTKLNLDENDLSDESLDEKTSYLFSHETAGNNDLTILSQMEFTKDLLSEEQRIALCKLVLVEMIQEISSLPLPLRRNNGHMFISASQNMELWSQKILARLYAHMDISPDEQVMVERLSKHGVVVSDMAFILMSSTHTNHPTYISSNNYGDLNAEEPPLFVSNINALKNSSDFSNKDILKLDIRWTILCDLFLLLVADSVYDSRSRVFLQRLGKTLSVSALEITMFEKRITDELVIQEKFETSKNRDAVVIRDNLPKNKRYMLMALATISGGLVIGLSSGILAPLIGAGLGAAFTTIGVAGTTGFLAGSGGAALITTGGVVTGSSIAVKKMSNRIKNIETFEFKPLYDNKRLNLLITVPGWMLNEDDVRLPFSTIDPIMGDVYSVLWEPEILQSMGKSINILATEILTQSLQQVLGQTVLVALMNALQWPLMLTKLGYLIDNPFITSLQRAKAAGIVLADILLHRKLGVRPISLVGFSLGSRVIYYCLLELARKHAYGIIQDVYLFGTPVVINQNNWIKASSVVAGRFVNGYITNDWVLGCLFRITYSGIGRIAGLQPIEKLPNIENLDLTDLVDGHMYYREAMPKLMKKVGWVIRSEEFEEIEVPDPDKHRERQRELLESIEIAKKNIKHSKKISKNSNLRKLNIFRKKEKNAINSNTCNNVNKQLSSPSSPLSKDHYASSDMEKLQKLNCNFNTKEFQDVFATLNLESTETDNVEKTT
ncbi:unnamed protein product [Pneumocystis jirovecii]|uniref:DUF726-domain-containing protein n=1 Tax=Pneumocystis jirovecii TaxID=42068 RepID=L0PFJ6_PNEJI|nr:unnamed protein product [Pneumocystis jirovecii]